MKELIRTSRYTEFERSETLGMSLSRNMIILYETRETGKGYAIQYGGHEQSFSFATFKMFLSIL